MAGIEDQFNFNSMIANTLGQLFTSNDRKVIRRWIEKLHSLSEKNEQKHEYMWFLLKMLNGKVLLPPFDYDPPGGDLLPLRDATSSYVYDDVLASFDRSDFKWIDSIIGPGDSGDNGEIGEQPTIPPPLFLDSQPKPKQGVICYMAAFSDQDPLEKTQKQTSDNVFKCKNKNSL